MRSKSKIFRALVTTVMVISLLVSCASNKFDQFAEKPLVLNFIETSDIHGSIFPLNFITGQQVDASMYQVASYVAAQRASGNEVVLLDCGDSLQGQPPVYYYNFIKTEAVHIWAEVLNFLNYDAATVGNHDIEAGHDVYDKMVKELNLPFICANVEVEGTGKPYFEPYTMIERQGVKIAVLGMVEPGITKQLPQQFWAGMDVLDMVETAEKWVPIIQKKEKPDLLIGLFHAGVDYTYGGVTADEKFNESGSQLVAERVEGFDIVFVGHDHAGWDGKGWDPAGKEKVDVKSPSGKIVPIYGANAGAQNVASVTIEMLWDRQTKSWKKENVSGALVAMKGLPADPAFAAKFDPSKEEVSNWVDRPIGKMKGKMTSHDALFGDSAFVDLIHRIQLELCEDSALGLKPARISIAAPLDQNAFLPSTPDGTILVRDMFSLYKFENFMYTMDLTGKQLKDFMEYNYGKWMNTMVDKNDHLIAFAKDTKGELIYSARSDSYDTITRAYNYDSIAGIKYTVDVSKPMGKRINIISFDNGDAFSMTEKYSVAINSYRASGGGGHLTTGSGLDLKTLQRLELVTSSTVRDLRYYMLAWFEKQVGVIEPTSDNNWKVIPEDWAAAGRAKSFPLVYPVKK